MCNNSSMQNSTSPTSRPNLSSVAQALRILDELRAHEPLGVTEIANRMGVAVSTAHRLLSTLVAAHYVRQPSRGGKYYVGPLLNSSAEVSAVDHCVEMALPHMERLRDLSGETIHLARLQQHNLKFVAAMESLQPMRVTNRAGRLLPAHATAAGKLLLSLREDEESSAFVADGAAVLTQQTITDADAFRAELVATRKAGYGRAISEAEIGVAALAVPVFRPAGEVVCALTLTGPLARFYQEGKIDEQGLSREPEFVAGLRMTSGAITADLKF